MNTLIRSWVLLCNPIVELGMLRVVDLDYSLLIHNGLVSSENLYSVLVIDVMVHSLIFPPYGYGLFPSSDYHFLQIIY